MRPLRKRSGSYKGGALQAALYECQKAIACATVDDNPMRLGTDRAYRLMSRIRLDQGRNQEALELVLKATDMEDDFDRALAYLRVGNMAQARAICSPEMLRRGISVYDVPDLESPRGYEAAILFTRISLGVRLEDLDLPLMDLRKCLELVPTFAGAANSLAWKILVDKKNLAAAIPYYFLVAKFGHGGMVRDAMRYLTDEQVRQAGGREALLARAGQE